MKFEPTLDKAKDILAKASRPLFLTGAGISTASGIPDFRSPTGLYNIQSKYGVPYERMLSNSYFFSNTKDFYSFYWESMVYEKAKPNAAHLAIASYGKKHKTAVITQNIDGLHELAGSSPVYDVHGSVLSYTCLKCYKRFCLEEIPHKGIPTCDKCGGVLKPDVVLYEEALDPYKLSTSMQLARDCDVLVVVGTSLRVYPIAALPEYASKAIKILVNFEATSMDNYFDYVIHGDAGEVLSYILGE